MRSLHSCSPLAEEIQGLHGLSASHSKGDIIYLTVQVTWAAGPGPCGAVWQDGGLETVRSARILHLADDSGACVRSFGSAAKLVII